MEKTMWALALLFVSVTFANAQTHDMSTMSFPSNQIDGSQNPDQIPDHVAFALWLEAHTQEPQNDLKRTFHFADDTDNSLLLGALDSYRGQHGKFLADRTSGLTTRDQFWLKTYELSKSLLAGIETQVSLGGSQAFANFLEHYKLGIRLSGYDPSLTTAKRDLRELSMFAGPPQVDGMTPSYSTVFENNPQFPHYSYVPLNGPGGSTFGPNGTAPAAPWVISWGSFTQQSGSAFTTSTQSAMYYNVPTLADGCSSGTPTVVPGTLGAFDGIFRRFTNFASHKYFYFAAYQNSGVGTWNLILWKVVNGSWYQLAPPYAVTFPGLDAITLCTFGDHISASLNQQSNNPGTVHGAVVLAAQDSSIAGGFDGVIQDTHGGNSPGIAVWSSSSGFDLYSNVTLTGDTICPSGCPHGAMHTGQVTNKYGTHGGTTYGTAVPPQNPMTVQSIQTFDLSDDPGEVYNTNGEVLCSIVGLFFSAPGPGGGVEPLQEEYAITMSQNKLLGPTPNGTYPVSNYCTAATSPPDASPTYVYNEPVYNYFWKSIVYCERPAKAGLPWNCAVTGENFPYPKGTQLYNCTNYDKGFDGKPWP